MVDRPGGAQPEVRQRWRVAFARGEPLNALGQPELAELWDAAVRRAGLPVATSLGRNPRPRLVFAAPLPVWMPAEHDLFDVVLGARRPISEVRTDLEVGIPVGLRIVDLFDVWVGAPSLPAALTAADYRVTLAGVSPAIVADGCARLLAKRALPRERVKGEGRAVRYDLRPLLVRLDATDDGLRMRVRHEQERGIGRPDEVILAIGEALDVALQPLTVVRERLWTADELPAVPGVPTGVHGVQMRP